MTLTLITINFNGADTTIQLLESLRAQTDTEFDIIIVENDSEESDRERLGAYIAGYPGSLDLISSPRNLGFSGGNNLGIRKALAQGTDWVLLINNDTTVAPDFIARVRAQLVDGPSIVGLPLQEGDRIARAGQIRWCTSTLPHIYDTIVEPSQTYAIGAGVVIHRGVFERIGFLDESYFLYFEDADFTVRARRAGIPIRYLAYPLVQHALSASTRALGSPLLLRYHLRNSIRFNRRHAPWQARIALPLVLGLTLVKQLVKLAIGRDRAQSIALLQGLRDGLIGSEGRITTLPIIAIECESLEDTSWGTARMIRGFLTAFVELPEVRKKYEVVAYFKSHIPDEPWLRHTHVRGVVIRPLRWLPTSFSLYFYVFFPIRLWFDRPMVTYIANYMLPLIFRGKSIVLLTEDVWYEMHGGTLPFRYRLAYRIFSTWAAQQATRIMAITHASATRVSQLFGIAPHRLLVNELAVDQPRSVPPRAGNYIAYVGQGLPRRHARETIQAFALIARQHPTLSLYIVAPDKYEPPVISRLVSETNSTLGRSAIQWVQRVTDDELASIYAGARLLVYVSDMEAFGLPPVEALSYGIPSVLMDAPVHRELFGEYAFYTTSAKPNELARVLERGLSDNAHRHAIEHAAQSVVSRYTWDAHARRMLAAINDLA